MLRLLLWLALLLAGASAHAADDPVRLSPRVLDCAAPARSRAVSCSAADANRTWLVTTDTRRLAKLPAGWRLLVDQSRFSSIRVEVIHDRGTLRIDRRYDELADHWSLGNNLKFEIEVSGAEVRALRIGFEHLDDAGLIRSVKAMSPAAHSIHKQRWTATIALISGVLVCSLAYNLFLMVWLKTSFQRWYVVWIGSALAYMLLWSGVAFYAAPDLAGPMSIRVGYALVGLMIASATGFFFELIEPGKLPHRLVWTGHAVAGAVLVCGIAGAFDPIVPPTLSDRLLNLAFIAATLCVAFGLAIAIRRGSRTVWFYLAGWTPPLVIFALRIARNFGLVPQSDLVDMATFAAIGLEAVILSLAIADRFRELRRERDAAETERETLRRVAITDPLTGLPNRAAFQERLAHTRGGAADLVMIDLDHLKETNDTAGHDAGDALIIEAGRRLRHAAGPGAMVARIGGDEFAVVLEGEQRKRLSMLLREIELSGTATHGYGGRQLALSMSAGHSAWEAADDLPERLYKKADLALYRAKTDGRGVWRSYAAAMHDEVEAARRTVAEARTGLLRDEFLLHCQPIVDLRSGDLAGHEALLRWNHPERGLLNPSDFAAAFDDPALAMSLQAFALGAALDFAIVSARPISVNFVAAQLRGEACAATVLACLHARGLAPSALVVEVTETVVLGRHDGPIVECLRQLRSAGVEVALDDFGTGYASLVHLRDFPADVLKIDRSFVMGLPKNRDSQKIVRAIVALAHGLGKRVVAEGIETEAQRDFIRRLGCDMAQGYLLGRPVPIVEAMAGREHAA